MKSSFHWLLKEPKTRSSTSGVNEPHSLSSSSSKRISSQFQWFLQRAASLVGLLFYLFFSVDSIFISYLMEWHCGPVALLIMVKPLLQSHAYIRDVPCASSIPPNLNWNREEKERERKK